MRPLHRAFEQGAESALTSRWLAIILIGCSSLLVSVAVAALWSGAASAAPAAPVDSTLKQPNGKAFKAKPWGDEWTNGFETPEGFTIVRNRASGAWEYAEKGPQGTLKPSGEKVALGAPPSGVEKHLRPEEPEQPDADEPAPPQQSPEPQGPSLASPNTGTQKQLVILVKFADQAPVGSTPAQWRSKFFGASESVKHYYQEASYGKLNIAPAAETHGTANDGVVGWIKLNQNHPNTGGNTGEANARLTRDAVRAADQYVNFKAYDKNGNGYLSTKELHVTVIVAGYEAAGWSSWGKSVWGHQWSLWGTLAPNVDGVVFGEWTKGGGYTQFGEWHGDHMATIGIMAHELGHDLGLPDLYDTDGSSEGIGNWSVMAGGTWLALPGKYPGSLPALPDAFSKSYEGWLKPQRVSGTGVVTSIPQAETNATAIQLRNNPFGVDWTFGEKSGTGEYFLIENRQKVGYDAALPGSGLLVWHIDETRTSTNGANANEARKLVDLEEADGWDDLDTGWNRGDAGDTYPGSSSNRLFNKTSYPNSLLYGGLLSRVTVSNISASSPTMSATLTAP